MIIFSSSDITALYKKDIVKVLSLPKGFCIHFRYEHSDISSMVLRRMPHIIGREGLIIYTKDNDPNKKPEDRIVTSMPIRRVTVAHYREDTETKLHHFNLELGDFISCDYSIHAKHAVPPFCSVFEGDINQSTRKTWVEKVEELVNFDRTFLNHLFFSFGLYKTTAGYNSSVDILFDKPEEVSYFQLSETSAYILDLSIYVSETIPTEIEKYECKLEYEKKDILISNPTSIIIGSQKDNRKYKLITKSIDNRRAFDYVKMTARKNGTGSDEFYEMVIRFNVMKSTIRAFIFTWLFIMNLFGTALLAYVFTKGMGFWLGSLAVMLVIISAAGQYMFYSKSK